MDVIILLAAIAMIIFALAKGYIGIYGSAVYKDRQPYLFWGQILILAAGSIMLIIALLRGDL